MSKKAGLKIGLDFHGVVSARPKYFAQFTAEAVRRGHEIHIITGGPSQVVAAQLRRYHIAYTKIFAVLDYYDARGQVTYFDNGEYKVPDRLWDSAKAEYCSIEGINMHIDDSSEYVKWFTTPYCRYQNTVQDCVTENDFHINFNAAPQQALDEIENIISKVQYS